MNREVHVHPLADLIEHDLIGGECVCGPTVEQGARGCLYIHHSLDGREQQERS